MIHQGLDPPEYFEREKHYTNGAGCEILSYNEDGETKFMFYDGRGSNVAGLDIFGNELYSIDYSNISFGCVLYDEDLGSYIDESSGSRAQFENLSYSIFANTLTKKIRFGRNLHSKQQTASLVSWDRIMWMCGNSRTQEQFLDCALEVICGFDFDCMDGGDGGDGGDGRVECSPDPVYFSCSGCSSHKKCHTCCGQAYTKCLEQCDLLDWGIIYMGFWDTCRKTCDRRYRDCGIDCDDIW